MSKKRTEVAKDDCWNVDALYPNIEKWTKDFEVAAREKQNPHWPELNAFRGKLGDGADILKTAIEKMLAVSRQLSLLYTYAHLRHDEDITEDKHKVAQNRIISVLHDFAQEVSWFEPELLALSDSLLAQYLASPVLKDYKFYLEKILRIKPHTLPQEQEEMLAMVGKALETSHKAFSALNDADLKFGTVKDNEGKERELTHGLYGLYIRDQDRELRKNAFLQMHGIYGKYENTLTELINGAVQSHAFNAKARKYASSLEASLFPKNVDTAVYHALVNAVHDGIGTLHQYVKLRQRILGVDKLHLYDMYVPLTPKFDMKMSYADAEDIVVESVAPLGQEYQSILKKGFKEQRWVDRYENLNKRSGAYSSGCYDSMPYILMNYKDVLRDVFTLAHEAGHSMHSYLTHKNQPYQYGDYSIFLAEVASTFNEDLLGRLLIERAKTKEEKVFLINQKIEDIRTTLFRQTMFAEFELLIHTMAESNIPLTPKALKDEFRKLNVFYFGKDVVIDDEADVEWSRIPHFYYNFYVYQYATGISAALALSDRVVNGGVKERDEYLSFLKGGSSKYPIDMLKMAGVDMRSPQPVLSSIKKFGALVEQLEKLT
jgi:oligoendopeptidase F